MCDKRSLRCTVAADLAPTLNVNFRECCRVQTRSTCADSGSNTNPPCETCGTETSGQHTPCSPGRYPQRCMKRRYRPATELILPERAPFVNLPSSLKDCELGKVFLKGIEYVIRNNNLSDFEDSEHRGAGAFG